MRIPAFLSATFLAVMLVVASTSPASAALNWYVQASSADLDVFGRIEFDAPSGDFFSGDTDGVIAFELQATTFGHEWSCSGLDCLAVAQWSILPDWELDFIFFRTNDISTEDFGVEANLVFDAPGSSISECDSLFNPFACGGNGFGTATAPVSTATPVPEPGTLALIAAGLAGIGLARRRRTAAVTPA